MKTTHRKRGILFLSVGVLLLLVAVLWFGINQGEDARAGAEAESLLRQINSQMEQSSHPSSPEKGQTGPDPDPLPVITVDGEGFCGRIVIDQLGVELPVFYEWSYDKLKKAPCRYQGTLSEDNMIIAAHNYKSHFGGLNTLEEGDIVRFINGAGVEYRYSVKRIILLDGTAVTDMTAGDWDFTLFTCTVGGKQRVTVRCERIEA